MYRTCFMVVLNKSSWPEKHAQFALHVQRVLLWGRPSFTPICIVYEGNAPIPLECIQVQLQTWGCMIV